VFGLFVHDRRSGDWQITTDSSGLYRIFYDETCVATSFLELIRARRPGAAGLDRVRTLEFLAYGGLAGPGSCVEGVRRLTRGEILVLPGNGAPAEIRQAQAGPDPEPQLDAALPAHFADLALSLEGKALSVDATGGFDSRLVLGLLARSSLQFELAVSGQPRTPDTEIARRLAAATGRPLFLSGHDLGDFDASLIETFRFGDGMTDVRRLHRDRQLALHRLARGIDSIAHGGGGEFLRDHYVIQDFPFYGSARVNLTRFHDTRLMPVALPRDALTREGAEIIDALRTDVLNRCAGLRRPSNNETYDQIYFTLRAPEHFGQYYSNYINQGLDVVAPLLDERLVRAAMALSPWHRFFHRWQRGAITRHAPKLAALPTADGFTASSSRRLMVRDIGAYGRTQTLKALRKASQRLAGRPRFYTAGAFAADAPGFMARLRASPHFARSVAGLKSAGILAAKSTGADLRDVHVGRVLTIGLLIEELEAAV
jgi:hypothetical protein